MLEKAMAEQFLTWIEELTHTTELEKEIAEHLAHRLTHGLDEACAEQFRALFGQ